MKEFLYFIGTGVILSPILYFFFDYQLSDLFVTIFVLAIAYGFGRLVRDYFDKRSEKYKD